MNNTLKYELSTEEVNFLLGILNRAQVSGVQTAQALIAVVQKLQTPVNSEELSKEQYEELKAKFEPADKPAKK